MPSVYDAKFKIRLSQSNIIGSDNKVFCTYKKNCMVVSTKRPAVYKTTSDSKCLDIARYPEHFGGDNEILLEKRDVLVEPSKPLVISKIIFCRCS